MTSSINVEVRDEGDIGELLAEICPAEVMYANYETLYEEWGLEDVHNVYRISKRRYDVFLVTTKTERLGVLHEYVIIYDKVKRRIITDNTTIKAVKMFTEGKEVDEGFRKLWEALPQQIKEALTNYAKTQQ